MVTRVGRPIRGRRRLCAHSTAVCSLDGMQLRQSRMAAACADTTPPVAGEAMTDGQITCELQRVARNSTVTFTATDSSPEFEELLGNWLCHMRGLAIPVLVWSLDEATHAKMRTRQVASVYSRALTLPSSARPGEYKRPSSEECELPPCVVRARAGCHFCARLRVLLVVPARHDREPKPPCPSCVLHTHRPRPPPSPTAFAHRLTWWQTRSPSHSSRT